MRTPRTSAARQPKVGNKNPVNDRNHAVAAATWSLTQIGPDDWLTPLENEREDKEVRFVVFIGLGVSRLVRGLCFSIRSESFSKSVSYLHSSSEL